MRYRRPVFLESNVLENIIADNDHQEWSIIAEETAQMLFGQESIENEQVRDRIIQIIKNNDIEKIAVLWSKSPDNSLAGIMWRSFLIYEWHLYDEENLREHYDNGIRCLKNCSNKIDYETIIFSLVEVMKGNFELKKLNVFYMYMVYFLKILALGVAFEGYAKEDLVFDKKQIHEMLYIKAKAIIEMAKQFEDSIKR